MKLLGSEPMNYAHLVYQELSTGGHSLIKDRFGNTTMTVTEALDSNLRVAVVDGRRMAVTVNSELQRLLDLQGFEIPSRTKIHKV